MTKLIPYGAKLEKLIMSGKKPNNDVYCFCGTESWRKSESFNQSRYVLCLPPGANPFNFRWPVKGCDLLLFGTDDMCISDIEKIAYCLLLADAAIVRAVPFNQSLIIYRENLI